MPLHLIRDQSSDAFTPGIIVKPGPSGWWMLPNEVGTDELRLIPWVAAILFVLIAGLVYVVDIDETGRGFSGIKIAILSFWGLIMATGAWSNLQKLRIRERIGTTVLEVMDPILAPGVSTKVRLSQTEPLSMRSLVVDVVCILEGQGESKELWNKLLCKLGANEVKAGEAMWESELEIPSEAAVARPSASKLEDPSWDPDLGELGPSLEIASRAGGRSWQNRYWKLRVSILPVDGVVLYEYFDLRVFFGDDRQTLVSASSET